MRKPYNYATRKASRYIANGAANKLNKKSNRHKQVRPLSSVELIAGVVVIIFWIIVISLIF